MAIEGAFLTNGRKQERVKECQERAKKFSDWWEERNPWKKNESEEI